jgi:hypothetical protein
VSLTPEELRVRAMELYEERNKLARLYYLLDLPTLKRLNAIVAVLDEDALREVVGYAEGLAAWATPDSESTHASIPQQSPAPG